MKIGIIFHSKTGTTLGFGHLIGGTLREGGHQVELVDLQTDAPVNFGSVRSAPPFKVTNLPDGSKYEALLVGGPVWAFSASPVIYAAVKELKNIKGKKVLPFVTMGFPLPGMGGKQAIALLDKELTAAGAIVLPGVIIPKMFHDYQKLMAETAQKIKEYFV
ncbi:MAG: flavodoxin family protein [Bacteroidota bacterium]